MAFQFNKTLILAKLETTYGTDPTPAEDADEILCGPIDFGRNMNLLQRFGSIVGFGGVKNLTKGESFTFGFETEIIPSGAAGTAPKIGKLLQACNMTETVTGGTSVLYANNSLLGGSGGSGGAKSLTIWYYQDAILKKAVGCRGTWKLTANPGETAKIRWDFTGKHGTIAAGTFPTTPTFDTGAPLVFESAATLEWQAAARTIASFTYDHGNTLSKRTSGASASGIAEWLITQRMSKASYVLEAIALGTLNLFNVQEADTLQTFEVELGTAAGSIMNISIPYNQITNVTPNDQNNLLYYQVDCDVKPTVPGNDEIQILFT